MTTIGSYQQPEKNLVRERMLKRAIQVLTMQRPQACIVREEELTVTAQCFLEFLGANSAGSRYSDATRAQMSEWLEFHSMSVGARRAGQLRVLYLCGPEPRNDLSVMIGEGVSPHNVWALTADSSDHGSATDACASAGISLKIHHGKLDEFLSVFNETFDIIYIDACGPYAGGKPNTLHPIVSTIERQRLNSPGVLITNFCQPPEVGDAKERFVDLVTAYFTPRYRDLPLVAHEHGPDPAMCDFAAFRRFASAHLEQLYSEFITRLTIDIGMKLVPNCRALSMSALYRSYIAAGTNGPRLGLNLSLTPSSYPLAAFIAALNELRKDDQVIVCLKGILHHQTRKLDSLVEAASMLEYVFEGHAEVLSAKMRQAIDTKWFDTEARLTCDLPLPHLTINCLLSLYGRPWFVNPRCSDRVSYTAKRRRMYCDLLVVDQCRPFFDWLPTVDMWPSRLKSIPFQIVARSIMDRIGRHNIDSETHPFRGAAVLALGEHPVAGWYSLQPREAVGS